MDVFPYGDTIDVIEMKGDDVLNALEYSVDDLASTLSPQREFLQTAGWLKNYGYFFLAIFL